MTEREYEKEDSKEMIDESESEIYKGKDFLTDIETYLKSGIHIGTKFKTGEMMRYVFKKRRDRLNVFNIETIDKRIRMVAKMLAKYEGKDIVVVSRKLYGQQAAKKFAALIGAKAYTGRFIPGTFTNPQARLFHEPKVLMICDPLTDYQAIKEAFEIHVPIVGLVGTDSPLAKVDLAIPANNKGRKAIALIFYLLARELLVARGDLSKDNFTANISDFEQEIEKGSEDRTKRRFDRRDSNSSRRPRSSSGGSRRREF